MTKLLVVDDESLICHSFRRIFTSPEVEVRTASTLAEGWQSVQENQPDVIVLDLQLPDGSGLDLFDRIRAADPKRPVIFITAHGTTDTAIEAMKRGAFDYLTKPIDLEQMNLLLTRAFDAARLMHEPAKLPEDSGQERIIGRSVVMQETCKQIGRIASQEANVLITGESGTGKDWSRASSSVTNRERSRELNGNESGGSSSAAMAHFYWTRSATCRFKCR
jgi:two-component system nitrogen regulation response regulator GlnG